MQDSFEILKSIPIFSNLSSKTLKSISELQRIKVYKRDSVIIHEGDKGDAFFFIRSGKVKIYKTSEDGRYITLNILGAGSIFAEVTLFNNINYPATVEAIENAEIGIIFNSSIEKLIIDNSELALQIIKVLNKRLYRSQMTIKEMAFNDTYIRIVNTLLTLCKTHGKNTSLGIKIDINITRQDIANMVGTTRETASRIISDLKKDGIVTTDSKKIIVLSIDKLKSITTT